jgi:hypothetical protein
MERLLFKTVIQDLDDNIQDKFNSTIGLINNYQLIEYCLLDLEKENTETKKVTKSLLQLWNAKVVNICNKAQSVELKSIGVQLLYETVKASNYEYLSDNFKQWVDAIKALIQKV